MNYNEVFSFNNLLESAYKCFRGVGWKCSTQLFKLNLIVNVYHLWYQLRKRNYKSKGFYEFDINERGKVRHIKSVHISERIVQRCLCDYYLTPLLSKTFIYDSGASLKGKGFSFSINRLTAFMHKYYRHYGNKGYYLKIDFTKYFENVDHSILKEKLNRYLTDNELKDLTFTFIDNCGDKGLGLGSQVSQICALFYISSLDHYIKEKLHIKYYVRYMDDAVLLFNDKLYLKECLIKIRGICDGLNITINDNKTQIVSLSNGIVFLKRRFKLTNSGKVLRHFDRDAYKREKHKLDTIKEKSDKKVSFLSWSGSYKCYNEYYKIYNLERIYLKNARSIARVDK